MFRLELHQLTKLRRSHLYTSWLMNARDYTKLIGVFGIYWKRRGMNSMDYGFIDLKCRWWVLTSTATQVWPMKIHELPLSHEPIKIMCQTIKSLINIFSNKPFKNVSHHNKCKFASYMKSFIVHNDVLNFQSYWSSFLVILHNFTFVLFDVLKNMEVLLFVFDEFFELKNDRLLEWMRLKDIVVTIVVIKSKLGYAT